MFDSLSLSLLFSLLRCFQGEEEEENEEKKESPKKPLIANNLHSCLD